MSGPNYQIGPNNARNRARNALRRQNPNLNRQLRQQECYRRYLAMQPAQVAQQGAQVQQVPQKVQQAVPLLAICWKKVGNKFYLQEEEKKATINDIHLLFGI